MNRTNPYQMMEQFFERMNEEFDEFGRPSGGMLGTGVRDTLTVDVADREDVFEVTVDAPGFERDEIDEEAAEATLTNGVLTVTLPKVEAEESGAVSVDID